MRIISIWGILKQVERLVGEKYPKSQRRGVPFYIMRNLEGKGPTLTHLCGFQSDSRLPQPASPQRDKAGSSRLTLTQEMRRELVEVVTIPVHITGSRRL